MIQKLALTMTMSTINMLVLHYLPRLCSKFASKILRGKNSMFMEVGTHANTRHTSDIVREYKSNFGRFRKSSLPFLARLINENNRKR